MRILYCVLILCAFHLHTCEGDLYDIFGPCCHEGVQWSSASYRCDNYPGPVMNISDNDQAACLSIIEVCCIKQTQLLTCENGKQTALDSMVCAIRDTEPGAEQFRECCHCCQLGLVSRQSTPACQPPGLGEPCDSKYSECCRGEASGNLSFSGAYRSTSTESANFNTNSNTDERQFPFLNNGVSDNYSSNNNNVGGDDFGNFFNNNLQGNDLPEAGERRLGENLENDIDECSLFPGQVCSHFCINTLKGFYCACPDGFHLDPNDNRTCMASTELSESKREDQSLSCELNNPCEQRCINRQDGGVECRCYEGYRLAVDQTSCEDIDECAEGIARCSATQTCVNTRGRFTCIATQCPPDTELNPLTGQCDSKVEQCDAGFSFNTVSGRCEDLNECGLGIDHCGIGERCENTVGSYACRRVRHCGTGYTLEEESQLCVDNNECTLGTHNCNGGYRCQNTQGSFRCIPKPCEIGERFDTVEGDCIPIQCPVGLRPNEAGKCIDVNECEERGPNVCRRHQRCINSRGSYYCRNIINCPAGYDPRETSGCQDINECERGTHKCGVDQQCVNRQGSYFCQCPRGMKHAPNGRCVDVDECSYGAAICPSNSKCVNTIGSFRCDCVDGLMSDGNDACTDVDECQTDGICQQKCVNVLGTYFCSCNRGYQLRDDKRSCEDIDECTQFGSRSGRSGVCGGRCINIPGSYRCECPNGWRLKPDGRSCEDINECKEQTAFCPHGESMCINTRGGYKCPIVRCPDGFLKTNTTGQQNSELIAEEDGVVCRRKQCDPENVQCVANKTKTITWQFLDLPSVEFITAPLTILNIKTIGYSRYPNLRLKIIGGNDEELFDTAVTGDRAALRLLSPLKGPTDKEVVLELENRNFSGDEVISRHITHVRIFVGTNPF